MVPDSDPQHWFNDLNNSDSNVVGKFHLLDGDRIATLLAGYLQQLLQEAGLADKIRSVSLID